MAKVLVVDDSKLSRTMHALAVRELGHEVIEADNGETALELFEKELPDLVVTDLLMPRMSGNELLARLRERNFDVPIVVVSADIQQSSRQLCQHLGARAFFNKPLRTEEFARYLESIFCAGANK